MKKPQSISLLGNALFTGAQEAGSKRRRDTKKDSIKKKVLKYVFRGAESLGNKVLAKNNEQFLKNENFYARNAIIDANIEEDIKIKNSTAKGQIFSKLFNLSLTYTSHFFIAIIISPV